MIDWKSRKSILRKYFTAFSAALCVFILFGPPVRGGKKPPERDNIVEEAKKYIGVRYNYGGTSSRGFDCSGFVSYIYKMHGIELPRTSEDQYEAGKKISLEKARPGDLVFFRIYKGKISHVGIYLGEKRFIHSPSRGKRVSIADMNLPYWERSYAGAASFLED